MAFEGAEGVVEGVVFGFAQEKVDVFGMRTYPWKSKLCLWRRVSSHCSKVVQAAGVFRWEAVGGR